MKSPALPAVAVGLAMLVMVALGGCKSTPQSAGQTPATTSGTIRTLGGEEASSYVRSRLQQLRLTILQADASCSTSTPAPVCVASEMSSAESGIAELANGVAFALGRPAVLVADPKAWNIAAPNNDVRLVPPKSKSQLEERTYRDASAYVSAWLAYADGCSTITQRCSQLWPQLETAAKAVDSLGPEWASGSTE